MTTDIEYIGAGDFREVEVTDHGRSKRVRAHVNLFKTGLGVRHDEGGMRQLVVPYWDNHYIHELLKNGREPRYARDTLVHQSLESLFSAIRQTYHILWENYGIDFSHGVKGRLNQAIQLLDQMNLAALGFRAVNFQKWIRPFQTQIEQLFGLVGTEPRDLLKTEVVNYGRYISCGRDSLGRVNQSVLMSKIVASKTRLRKVVSYILTIEPRIVARQQALVSIVHYAEAVIAGSRQFLSLMLEDNQFRQLTDSPENQRSVNMALGFYIQQLKPFDMAPYYRTFFILIEEFRQAQLAIEAGKFPKVKELLSCSHESLKIRAIRLELERLLLHLLFNKTNPQQHPLNLEAVKGRLDDQIGHLEDVDETGFALPVCHDSLADLKTAAMRLNGLPSIKTLLRDRQFHHLMRSGVGRL